MAEILAVDDDASILRILELRLRLKGHSVTTKDNAVDALAYLETRRETPPHVIFSDVMMPGMDGYEFCRRVRALGVRSPFIFLSNRADSDDKVRGLESGADDYVLKPFDPIELEAKLARATRSPA